MDVSKQSSKVPGQWQLHVLADDDEYEDANGECYEMDDELKLTTRCGRHGKRLLGWCRPDEPDPADVTSRRLPIRARCETAGLATRA